MLAQTIHWSHVINLSNVLGRKEKNTHTHFNDFCCIDKINSIQVVFFHPSTNGEDIRVKDDVIWIEAQFFQKEMVGPGAHSDFGVCFCCLGEGVKDVI